MLHRQVNLSVDKACYLVVTADFVLIGLGIELGKNIYIFMSFFSVPVFFCPGQFLHGLIVQGVQLKMIMEFWTSCQLINRIPSL